MTAEDAQPAGTPAAATPAATATRGRPRRWPAFVAVLAIGVLYLLVSDRLTPGPSWLPLVVIAVILAPLLIAWGYERHDILRVGSRLLLILMTATIMLSSIYLVLALLYGSVRAPTLLQSAAVLWGVNVLTFALWYWEVDGGGPAVRHRDPSRIGDFVFPQRAIDGVAPAGWTPTFIDYLFLAFNTSTAFSPTDTQALTHRVKVLMMLQSLISLLIIVVLAARAINTLR